jgi:hypothetical protein
MEHKRMEKGGVAGDGPFAGLARRGEKGYQAVMSKRGGPDHWLHKLATLRVDRARGNPAPHKPFLLLVVLEMAEWGEIKGPVLPMSADLAYRFSLFNAVIADRKRAKLALYMPFHHLGSSGIWQPLMANGEPSPNRALTVKVRFDPDFLACLRDPDFRERAKRVLIDTPPYFPARGADRVADHAGPCAEAGRPDEGEFRLVPSARRARARCAVPDRSGCGGLSAHVRVDGLPNDDDRDGEHRGCRAHP